MKARHNTLSDSTISPPSIRPRATVSLRLAPPLAQGGHGNATQPSLTAEQAADTLQRAATRLELGDHGLQQRPLQRRPRAGGVARLEIAVLIEDEHVGEVPVGLAWKLVLGQLEDRVRSVPVDRGLGEQREVGRALEPARELEAARVGRLARDEGDVRGLVAGTTVRLLLGLCSLICIHRCTP